MREIRHRVRDGRREIASSEIRIPDDLDVGTGTFTTRFWPRTLPPASVTTSRMANGAGFDVSATVHANGDVCVDLTGPSGRTVHAVFMLPEQMTSIRVHVLRIQFVNWRIWAASLDGQPLIDTTLKEGVRVGGRLTDVGCKAV